MESVGNILSNFPNIYKDLLRIIVNEYELEFGIGIDNVDVVIKFNRDKKISDLIC